LRDASALGRFPTPIDDIMAAAKLTVVDDEVLNESMLRQFMNKAKSGIATIKSALSKVLGLSRPMTGWLSSTRTRRSRESRH
jgi:hypothetical protein